MNRWTRRRLGPGPDRGSGADIVSIMYIFCGCVNVVVLSMSLCSVMSELCMLMIRLFLSTLSLVAEWSL